MRLTTSGVPSTPVDVRSVLSKPFKVPIMTKPIERAQPERKRKRISYKGQAKDDDSDSDSESRKKRKKKNADGDYDALGDGTNVRKPHPAFKVKEWSALATKPFSIPTMRNKAGEIIPTVMTGTALGIRPLVHIPPRPLYDPMADHAIVLYDPTVDMRETDEERTERIKEEEKEKARKAAEEKIGSQNLFNPHKSLRELLGQNGPPKKIITKVPVVIDPALAAKLRPHQVEGVKVEQYVHFV